MTEEKKGHYLESLDAIGMLQQWGLRESGGSMGDGSKGTGGEAKSVDDEAAMVSYVNATQGFFEARPVLRHVYVHFRPIETYRHLRPGCLVPVPSPETGQILHQAFVSALNAKIKATPFIVPVDYHEFVPVPRGKSSNSQKSVVE